MRTIAEELHNLLKGGVVRFTFRKKDGSIRHALGTRNLSLADTYLGEAVPRPRNEEQPNSYYDLDKCGWRSYIPSNVISIDDVIALAVAEPKTEPKAEPTKREIPISMPTDMPTDMGERIRREIDKLDDDIEIPIGGMGMGMGFGFPIGGGNIGGKVGKPMPTKEGIALPISGIGGKDVSIDDFAKLVAKYVVAELADRLTK